MANTKIALFEEKKIRKSVHNNEWWFSIVDVAEALTDTTNPRIYWGVMKGRLEEEDGIELFTICKQFKLEAPDGKMRKTDCANTEGMFRIIQ